MATETEARVREVLSYISPNCDRYTWAEVICPGIKNALGEAGASAWHDWSKDGGDSYNFQTAEAVWRSWSEFGKRTFASVVRLAKAEGYDPKGKYTPPTAEQKKVMEEKARAAAIATAAKKKQAAEVARKEGLQKWEEAIGRPADAEHPYLKAKGVQPHGLRIGQWTQHFRNKDGTRYSVQHENVLLVPIRGREARSFHGVQGITAEGTKLHQKGVAKQGHFAPIVGSMPGRVLAEGWATAASIQEMIDLTTLSCFDASNVMEMARQMYEAGKSSDVIIGADNDTKSEAEGKGNRGMEVAFEAGRLFNMRVAFPPDGGDWNDFVARARANGDSEESIKAAMKKHFDEATVPTGPYVPTLGQAEAPGVGHDEEVPLQPTLVLDDSRPTIRIERNNVKAINDQAEKALMDTCPFLFQRSGDIVRPVIATMPDGRGGKIRTVKIRRLNRAALQELLDSAANWIRYDARSKKDVLIDAPLPVADALLARGKSRLRPLNAVIEAPTLRADGSILDVPGYDAATGLLYVPSCEFRAIPQSPTMADAAAALRRIEANIDQFPYVSPVDRSVALSAVLTCAVRRSLPRAPMFGMGATAAGSGKSSLVDYSCIIATGSPVPVFSQGNDEAEMEKRLHGALLAGHAVVSFDNVTRAIEGNALCQAMTQETMEVRPLGTSDTRTVPTSTTFFATGNGLVVREDMTRRVLECRLDPGMERPELRSFTFDPLEVAKAQRASLLVDALIVIRAHHVAQAGARSKRFGFDKWSAMVADALVWLGYADPAESMDRTRANDPAKEDFNAVAREWRRHFGDKLVSVREAIDVATHQIGGSLGARFEFSNPDFREALLQVAGAGGAINSKKLGWWLKGKVGTIVDHLTVLAMGGAQKVHRWGFGSPVVAVESGSAGDPAAAVDDGPPLG
jgi:phage/plasmid primase-like uncharacterized protein